MVYVVCWEQRWLFSLTAAGREGPAVPPLTCCLRGKPRATDPKMGLNVYFGGYGVIELVTICAVGDQRQVLVQGSGESNKQSLKRITPLN